jgi:hypothetical protein
VGYKLQLLLDPFFSQALTHNTEGTLHYPCQCWGDKFKSLWVSVLPLLSEPNTKITWVQDSCLFVGKHTTDKAVHKHGLMWFSRKTVYFSLLIVTVKTAQFCKSGLILTAAAFINVSIGDRGLWAPRSLPSTGLKTMGLFCLHAPY